MLTVVSGRNWGDEGIPSCRNWPELPVHAKTYIEHIETRLHHEIQFICVEPERDPYLLKGEWL